ncbi:MAG TPA: type II toxin-antitoxin system VapC family toxin, partial [Aquamicrobium sp.]|nr:type II toxin-antitoxin system VapC family toxin [Aquamicrobium sp.]
ARLKTSAMRPTPDLLRRAAEAVSAFVTDLEVEEIPISSEIGSRALEASSTYGKAVGHVADLNFGDCFAYACAKVLDVALLYKGNDFAKTDLA